jgi:hypothetical protein
VLSERLVAYFNEGLPNLTLDDLITNATPAGMDDFPPSAADNDIPF